MRYRCEKLQKPSAPINEGKVAEFRKGKKMSEKDEKKLEKLPKPKKVQYFWKKV